MLFDDTGTKNESVSAKPVWTDSETEGGKEFAAVSISAIFALAGGILSLLAFVNHSLWPIAVIALAAVLFAYWKILSSEGRLTGLPMVNAGLFLALLPCAAIPVQEAVYNRQLREQAKAFFPLVIQAAQKGDTLAVCQYQKFQTAREEVSDETAYWKGRLDDPMMGPGTISLITNPTLLALYRLGESARVTYDKTISVVHNPGENADSIATVYAVTYTEFGETKTFFITLGGTRRYSKKTGECLWKCDSYGKKPYPVKGNAE